MKKLTIAVALLATGCVAADPKKIEPMSISAVPYQALDCAALAVEDRRVAGELAPLIYAQQDRRKDDMIMGVLIGVSATRLGEPEHAAQISRLKGERETIASAKSSKGCTEPQAAVDVDSIKAQKAKERAEKARRP